MNQLIKTVREAIELITRGQVDEQEIVDMLETACEKAEAGE